MNTSALPATSTLIKADIVVADDNRDSADTLAECLRARGHAVRTAYSGHEAIQECEQCLPRFLILDLGMPHPDGYEVALEVRRRWRGAKMPVLVALTGWCQETDRRRASFHGFDHFFAKPVGIDDLCEDLGLLALVRVDK